MAFLEIILNMGIIHLPELEDYWRTSWVCSVPFFGRVLPRDRFELIFWMLHVGHSNAGSPARKIDKVNSFLNKLLARFQSSYDVGRNIAVDETMVGFLGRFAAKQYMPKKPTKWGIKAFTMADSATGYMVNILPYMGAETLQNASAEFLGLPQPALVFLELMGPYLNRGHHLFTDRYYTSIQMAQELTYHNTGFTGVSQKNRTELPDNIRSLSRMTAGEVQAYRSDRLLALAWQAEKRKVPVIMVSTEASAEMVTVQSSNSHIPPTTKPAAVNTYNHNMNGVDMADQLGVYYSFQRKTVKWWRKLVFWLLEVTVVNSYNVYRTTVTIPTTHLNYRRLLVESLAGRVITTAPPRPLVGRPRKRSHPDTPDPERLNRQLHLIARWDRQRDCIVCSRQSAGERRHTYYYGKTCKDNPTLYPDTCFKHYHTMHGNYKL